ncbi:alpha/beta hydrolase [Emticicia sp. 21SJ11W-3]|uniref:alpha/beta hydrolase n=1 Tax=Emticicia sp. 21SJ11W-3 TaxID=2916755 RepID=UPI00209D82A3|nr:alpha/beta hydrolase-fold protein [Emticicia sp. 21SJ11W-3]UTA68879.1 hypothetical protein MB380_03530 [Emticicia sp. 21SJ11W-3]
MKLFPLVLVVTITLHACSVTDKADNNNPKPLKHEHRVYAEAVKDTFNISIQLPEKYYKKPDEKYPTVYVLDANFYFPMLAEVVKQYETAGLLPPMILVGIGYKSFAAMDSLRERDYLYPAAIPSDEMKSPGGGKNFNTFITKQLIPHIDTRFRTQTKHRALLGHSFGGYFTLYALLNQLSANTTAFDNIASASPSLWYNNYYLNQLTDALKDRKTKNQLSIFISAGGKEDRQWNIEPVKKLSQNIAESKLTNVNLQYSIYNDLDHMDTALITYIKALQSFYKQPGS